jgi:hypothetical protein
VLVLSADCGSFERKEKEYGYHPNGFNLEFVVVLNILIEFATPGFATLLVNGDSGAIFCENTLFKIIYITGLEHPQHVYNLPMLGRNSRPLR